MADTTIQTSCLEARCANIIMSVPAPDLGRIVTVTLRNGSFRIFTEKCCAGKVVSV